MIRTYLPSDLPDIAEGLGPLAQRFAGKTVLLCGGMGFLGRHFCAFFHHLNKRLKKPCRIIALDNLITAKNGKALFQETDAHVVFREHDITKPLGLKEKPDFILQAAGIASPFYYRAYPLETLEAAISGTRHMLDLARETGARLLFFSSSEIYGDPDPKHVPTQESYRGNVSCHGPRACYDESKRVGETLCGIYHEKFGTHASIVRPFNVYGPGMQETDYRVLPNFASRLKAGQPFKIYGSGRQTRTFCYITDALEGFLRVLLLGQPGEAYNIGNPKPEVSMLDLLRVAEKVLRRKLPHDLVEYPDSYPADEPMRRCPDIRKAALQIDYKPRVGLEQGLKRFFSWTDEAYQGSGA